MLEFIQEVKGNDWISEQKTEIIKQEKYKTKYCSLYSAVEQGVLYDVDIELRENEVFNIKNFDFGMERGKTDFPLEANEWELIEWIEYNGQEVETGEIDNEESVIELEIVKI